MCKKVWVLTTEYNEYDQHGEYFVCVFAKHPALEVIAPILSKNGYLGSDMGDAIKKCEHVRKGGGRIGYEDQWFNLVEVDTL
jgi:hypothetical protein